MKDHDMPNIFNSFALLLLTITLTACGGKEVVKTEKPVAVRTAESTFKSLTLVQSKNNLMGACSSNHLQIQSARTEVLCLQNEIKGTRFREVERVVNDEFATKIQIVMQFQLADKNGAVSVIANTYVQYLAPVSVTSGLQTRTKNLLDDISYDEMKALLVQAGASD